MKKISNPGEWLLYAESDLALAKSGKRSRKILYETLCFHCQQSAEKSIKAVFIFYDIDFPKTHDIEFLLKLLKKEGATIPKPVDKAKLLSQYAVLSRYPGEELEVDNREYKNALKISGMVLQWAKIIIDKKHDKLF